jgi:hypothetical protein
MVPKAQVLKSLELAWLQPLGVIIRLRKAVDSFCMATKLSYPQKVSMESIKKVCGPGTSSYRIVGNLIKTSGFGFINFANNSRHFTPIEVVGTFQHGALHSCK